MADKDQIWPGLIGGERAKKLLAASLRNNRLVHNYLFEGPMGIGKFPFAAAFARSLICTEKQEGMACGECRDCTLYNHGRHPDVFVMSRESELTADEAREINNHVMLSPQRAERKVIVLDGIDRINPSAGNALLKTLEESPAGAVFILTTHRPEKLLPTILSRALRVPFKLMSSENLAHDYNTVLGLDPESSRQAADLSGGRPGWGIRFILHPDFRKLYDYGNKLIQNAIIKAPLSSIFHKEKLIAGFLEESGRIFTEQDEISGMDGHMIAQVLNGEKVDFKPVNFLSEDSGTAKRHLDALGFVLLGGIFRGMIEKNEIEGDPQRYIPLMEAFLEAPRELERYYNKDLVIERFILYAHKRYLGKL